MARSVEKANPRLKRELTEATMDLPYRTWTTQQQENLLKKWEMNKKLCPHQNCHRMYTNKVKVKEITSEVALKEHWAHYHMEYDYNLRFPCKEKGCKKKFKYKRDVQRHYKVDHRYDPAEACIKGDRQHKKWIEKINNGVECGITSLYCKVPQPRIPKLKPAKVKVKKCYVNLCKDMIQQCTKKKPKKRKYVKKKAQNPKETNTRKKGQPRKSKGTDTIKEEVIVKAEVIDNEIFNALPTISDRALLEEVLGTSAGTEDDIFNTIVLDSDCIMLDSEIEKDICHNDATDELVGLSQQSSSRDGDQSDTIIDELVSMFPCENTVRTEQNQMQLRESFDPMFSPTFDNQTSEQNQNQHFTFENEPDVVKSSGTNCLKQYLDQSSQTEDTSQLHSQESQTEILMDQDNISQNIETFSQSVQTDFDLESHGFQTDQILFQDVDMMTDLSFGDLSDVCNQCTQTDSLNCDFDMDDKLDRLKRKITCLKKQTKKLLIDRDQLRRDNEALKDDANNNEEQYLVLMSKKDLNSESKYIKLRDLPSEMAEKLFDTS